MSGNLLATSPHGWEPLLLALSKHGRLKDCASASPKKDADSERSTKTAMGLVWVDLQS